MTNDQRDTWNPQTTDTENTSPDRISLEAHNAGEVLVQAIPEDNISNPCSNYAPAVPYKKKRHLLLQIFLPY